MTVGIINCLEALLDLEARYSVISEILHLCYGFDEYDEGKHELQELQDRIVEAECDVEDALIEQIRNMVKEGEARAKKACAAL